MLAGFFVNEDVVTGEQAMVAMLVGDDLDGGVNLVVAFDKTANSGGQTGGETTSGEQGNATDRHGHTPFSEVIADAGASAHERY